MAACCAAQWRKRDIITTGGEGGAFLQWVKASKAFQHLMMLMSNEKKPLTFTLPVEFEAFEEEEEEEDTH